MKGLSADFINQGRNKDKVEMGLSIPFNLLPPDILDPNGHHPRAGRLGLMIVVVPKLLQSIMLGSCESADIDPVDMNGTLPPRHM